jgi:hypothetical protein
MFHLCREGKLDIGYSPPAHMHSEVVQIGLEGPARLEKRCDAYVRRTGQEFKECLVRGEPRLAEGLRRARGGAVRHHQWGGRRGRSSPVGRKACLGEVTSRASMPREAPRASFVGDCSVCRR